MDIYVYEKYFISFYVFFRFVVVVWIGEIKDFLENFVFEWM